MTIADKLVREIGKLKEENKVYQAKIDKNLKSIASYEERLGKKI